MIVDLAMWTRNSERTLDAVLTRIEQVIPEQAINHKFIIDDKSGDRTVEIAKQHGWDVNPNPALEVTARANEALRRVETDHWVSFKHDLLLSKDWWRKIPKHLKRKKVVVVQGIHLATNPLISMHSTSQQYMHASLKDVKLKESRVPMVVQCRRHRPSSRG